MNPYCKVLSIFFVLSAVVFLVIFMKEKIVAWIQLRLKVDTIFSIILNVRLKRPLRGHV